MVTPIMKAQCTGKIMGTAIPYLCMSFRGPGYAIHGTTLGVWMQRQSTVFMTSLEISSLSMLPRSGCVQTCVRSCRQSETNTNIVGQPNYLRSSCNSSRSSVQATLDVEQCLTWSVGAIQERASAASSAANMSWKL